jgi:hypothetical protein
VSEQTSDNLGLLPPALGPFTVWRLKLKLSDAEWERLQPFLPVSNGRCGGGGITGR